MKKNKEKTHRCNELLEHNKNFRNGHKIHIFYGYQFNNPYNEKNGETKGWWIEHLEHDYDWDSTFMSPICKISYCPCCGEKLCLGSD